jgi:hypothetical protein
MRASLGKQIAVALFIAFLVGLGTFDIWVAVLAFSVVLIGFAAESRLERQGTVRPEAERRPVEGSSTDYTRLLIGVAIGLALVLVIVTRGGL